MIASPRLTNAQQALLEMFSFEMSEAQVLAMQFYNGRGRNHPLLS